MSRGFSLAGLLRVRQLAERRAAGELAAANAAVRGNRRQREQALAQLHGTGEDPVDSGSLLAIAAARSAGRAALADLQALDARLVQEAERAAERYQVARSELKAVEKLEEQHQQQERTEQLRTEQQLLDEMAGTTARKGHT